MKGLVGQAEELVGNSQC